MYPVYSMNPPSQSAPPQSVAPPGHACVELFLSCSLLAKFKKQRMAFQLRYLETSLFFGRLILLVLLAYYHLITSLYVSRRSMSPPFRNRAILSPSQCRPISMLRVLDLSKTFEKIVLRKFILPSITHKINPDQFAYIPRPGSVKHPLSSHCNIKSCSIGFSNSAFVFAYGSRIACRLFHDFSNVGKAIFGCLSFLSLMKNTDQTIHDIDPQTLLT